MGGGISPPGIGMFIYAFLHVLHIRSRINTRLRDLVTVGDRVTMTERDAVRVHQVRSFRRTAGHILLRPLTVSTLPAHKVLTVHIFKCRRAGLAERGLNPTEVHATLDQMRVRVQTRLLVRPLIVDAASDGMVHACFGGVSPPYQRPVGESS
jgi:hypothetical protein